MNLLGILSLVWQVTKFLVGNEMFNKAMDHWVAGTSNKIDDMLWSLIEKATGVADEIEKKLMLEDGLKAIEEKYLAAKASGNLDELKAVTRTWTPTTKQDIQIVMAGEFTGFDDIA